VDRKHDPQRFVAEAVVNEIDPEDEAWAIDALAEIPQWRGGLGMETIPDRCGWRQQCPTTPAIAVCLETPGMFAVAFYCLRHAEIMRAVILKRRQRS